MPPQEVSDSVIANRLSYRKFYQKKSFDIQRNRLIKRIMKNKIVFLITLKKYQLLKYYASQMILIIDSTKHYYVNNNQNL